MFSLGGKPEMNELWEQFHFLTTWLAQTSRFPILRKNDRCKECYIAKSKESWSSLWMTLCVVLSTIVFCLRIITADSFSHAQNVLSYLFLILYREGNFHKLTLFFIHWLMKDALRKNTTYNFIIRTKNSIIEEKNLFNFNFFQIKKIWVHLRKW